MNRHEMFKQYAVNEVVGTYKNTRTRPRKGEEAEIEVPLKISASKGNLWVLVILPARYPIQKPIIQILNAKVGHQYIGKNFQVNHPSLTNWTQQSSLLFAIRSIHSEFDKTPPQLIKDEVEEEVKIASGPKSKTSSLLQNPDFDQVCDQLEGMSNDELKALLNEDMSTFTDNIKGIRAQAEENMKLKDDIEKLYEQYLEIRKEYDELKEQEQEIMMKLSKENIVNALNAKIDESRAKCDEAQESFSSGSIDFDDYISQYKKSLEQVHKYEIIKQKLG
uniref:VPS37 C-terminal domain-containing protein n=1 Tax=Euplotes crassus TaxID=5936 RepID=A0A7S3NTB2_EUPCR|mmetsp:Transcript_18218/g.17901  ORF Transcript_18218/g.17901 Transcript_18218/m.17901 type:complete len:277 (+) Transcript_18218:28-858(+)